MELDVSPEEEVLLLEALSKHFNRKASKQDFISCRLISHKTRYGEYALFFNDTELGIISKKVHQGRKPKISRWILGDSSDFKRLKSSYNAYFNCLPHDMIASEQFLGHRFR